MTLIQLFTAIANAIRAKKGSSSTIVAENFPTEISGIVTLNGETKTVTATTLQQTILPSAGKNAITEITVNPVTSTIDNNITAGNIKNGVSILGVTGNYTGTSPSGTINITENDTYDVSNYAEAVVNVSGSSEYNTKVALTGDDVNTIVRYILKLPVLDTSQNTNLSNLFKDCARLTEAPLINTSNNTRFDSMFENCESLTNLGFYDLRKATRLDTMCMHCENLINISGWETTTALTQMPGVFSYCFNLVSADLSGFKTSNVTNMATMFKEDDSLETIIFGNDFSIAKVTNMSNAFNNCPNLSNTTLNNILGILPTVNKLSSSNRKLSYIGLNSTQRTTCQTLSNWAAAQAAGWSAS